MLDVLRVQLGEGSPADQEGAGEHQLDARVDGDPHQGDHHVDADSTEDGVEAHPILPEDLPQDHDDEEDPEDAGQRQVRHEQRPTRFEVGDPVREESGQRQRDAHQEDIPVSAHRVERRQQGAGEDQPRGSDGVALQGEEGGPEQHHGDRHQQPGEAPHTSPQAVVRSRIDASLRFVHRGEG